MAEGKTPEELLQQLEDAKVKQSELNRSLEEQINLRERLEDLADKEIDLVEKRKKLVDELNAQDQARLDLEAKLLKAKEEQREMMASMGDEQEAVDEAREAYAQEILDLEKQITEQKEEQEKAQRAVNRATAQEKRREKNRLRQEEKLNKLREQNAEITPEKIQAEAAGQQLNAAADMASNFGGKAGSSISRLLHEYQDFQKKFQKFGFDKIFDKMGKKIGPVFKSIGQKFGKLGKFIPQGVKNKLSPALSKLGGLFKMLGPKLAKFGGLKGMIAFAALKAAVAVFKLVDRVDRLSKQVAQATGFASEFHDEIVNVAIAGNMAGIGFEEAAKGLTSLAHGLSSFLPQNEEVNQYLTMTVARLEKLGVSATDTVKSIDHMQRAMGLNAHEAANMTARVARMGKEVGITATKAIKDFNQAAPLLARYGRDNIEVFKDLQAQAKATGMSIDSLTSSVSKFDTFEGAAESAAALNAVLGTQLSQLELMNMTEAERVKTIRDQVKASVGNFDSLDKFTKLHITQAMGLKSVDEAQRLLNMSTAEYNKTLSGQQEIPNIQEELQKATEDLVPIFDQLKLGLMQFFLAFAPSIKSASKSIGRLTELLGPLFKLLSIIVKVILSPVNLMFFTLEQGIRAIMFVIRPLIGLLSATLGVFDDLLGLFSQTINPTFVQIFHFLAEGLNLMLTPMRLMMGFIERMSNKFAKLFLIMSGNADQLHHFSDNPFNVEDLMNLDVNRINTGLGKIKNAVMAIGAVDMSGILMVKPDGTALVGGSDVIKSVADGKLEIDVKMSQQSQLLPVVLQIGEKVLEEVMVNLEFAKVDQVASAG